MRKATAAYRGWVAMANTAGALKTLVEAAGLGVMVVRDALPKRYTLPALVIRESVGHSVRQHGDYGDPNASLATTEMVLADLWQAWRTSTGQTGESPTLPDALFKAIHGKRLAGHNKITYGTRVTDVQRIPHIDAKDGSKQGDQADAANVVQHAYTILLDRGL